MTATATAVAPDAVGPTETSPRALGLWAWCVGIYFLLPVAVFAVSWLRPLPALAVAAGVVGGCVALGKPGRLTKGWWLALAVGVAVAVTWTWASGVVGGGTLPTFDWGKHTALLGDMVRSGWPPRMQSTENEYFLRYYVAWYLIPAIGGKVAGIHATLWFAALWTALGYALVVAWVVERFARPWARVGAAVGFLLFGGLDLLGGLVTAPFTHRAVFGDFTHLEVWSGYLEYSSHTVQALWVPQHALGGWMGALLVLEGVRARRPTVCVLAVFAALLWSPFAAIGVAPLAAVGIVRLYRAGAVPWRMPVPVLSTLAMGAGALVLVVYLTTEPSGIPLRAMWSFDQEPPFPISYLLFVLFEVLVLFGVAAWVRGRVEWSEWTAVAVLLVLPFIVYGLFNDLSRRASGPGLFVLCVMVLTAAFDADVVARAFVRPARVVLWVLMAIAAVTPVVEVVTRVRLRDGYRTPIECTILDGSCSGIGTDSQNQYIVPTQGNRLHRLLR